jgi:hypothetical protein
MSERLGLSSCPCCGGDAGLDMKKGRSAIHTPYWRGRAFCKRCKITTPFLKSPEAVIKTWNRRHTNDQP